MDGIWFTIAVVGDQHSWVIIHAIVTDGIWFTIPAWAPLLSGILMYATAYLTCQLWSPIGNSNVTHSNLYSWFSSPNPKLLHCLVNGNSLLSLAQTKILGLILDFSLPPPPPHISHLVGWEINWNTFWIWPLLIPSIAINTSLRSSS